MLRITPHASPWLSTSPARPLPGETDLSACRGDGALLLHLQSRTRGYQQDMDRRVRDNRGDAALRVGGSERKSMRPRRPLCTRGTGQPAPRSHPDVPDRFRPPSKASIVHLSAMSAGIGPGPFIEDSFFERRGTGQSGRRAGQPWRREDSRNSHAGRMTLRRTRRIRAPRRSTRTTPFSARSHAAMRRALFVLLIRQVRPQQRFTA